MTIKDRAMMIFPTRSGRNALLAGVLFVLSAANTVAQESVQFTDVAEIAATVTAIDQDRRLVTLRGPQGNELTIEAGPEVRNFAQIEVGDTVRLAYKLVYSATRVDPAKVPAALAASSAAAARAAEGERPGVAMGAVDSMIVLIESIGPEGRTATFITPDGDLQAIYVQRQEARAFARSLAAGDLVELTVGEAAAITVEPIGE
jgi:hypothetical protein